MKTLIMTLALVAGMQAKADTVPAQDRDLKCRCDVQWDASMHRTTGYLLVRISDGKVIRQYSFDDYASDMCLTDTHLAEKCQ